MVRRLGVSRTPARMAMIRLKEEGLVEPASSGGFSVRGFTEIEVLTAIEIRATLEGLAARLAAERRLTSPQLEPLRQSIATISDLIAQPPGKDAAGLYVPSLSVAKRFANYVGSDNSSFWDYGYPSFCGIEDSPLNNPQYHRTTDRVSTIDFDFYTDVVRAGVATLAELASIDSVSSSVTAAFEPLRLKIGPVPSRNNVAIEMSARAGSPEFVEIHDVTGRLVTRLRPSEASGNWRAVWDGTDTSGRRAGPGIYFVKIEGRSGGGKVVLLR